MSKVALLGTGLIGSAMVEAMLRRGDEVAVWNRTLDKAKPLASLGARVAPTVSDAVQGAERVHVVVSDDAAVDAVLAQIDRTDAHVLDHSTCSPAGTRARFEACEARGLRFLHCPIFMSPAAARDEKGMILCAGPEARFRAVEPSLARMTGAVWWVGERPDLAAAHKLFGNLVLLVIAGGLSDVFRLAKSLGISAADAHALFSRFDAGSTLHVRGTKMARGDFAASFETVMARKDLRLMMETAQDLKLVPALAALLDEAIARGHGHDDVGAIAADAVLP